MSARAARPAPQIRLPRISGRGGFSPLRLLLGCCVALACSLGPGRAQEPAPERKIPSFAELEAAGAVIGEISIDNRNIFDPEDPNENGILYRAANFIHIRTRASVIRRQLLFKSGERVLVRLIEETERLLRATRILHDVSIQPIAYRYGVVDIEVRTRDSWTLTPGVGISRSGGSNRRHATVEESNAFGTGVFVGIDRTSDAARTTVEYRLTQPRALDGWTTIDYAYSQNNDGDRKSVSVTRPFYALDTRSAAGFSSSQDDRLESVFTDGATASQFRHRHDTAEAFGGWSAGLVEGWVHRYSAGFTWKDDRYSFEPGVPRPAQLPRNRTIAAPFLRHEITEDSIEKVKNRDSIERPEYVLMGWESKLQLGRTSTGFGSTEDLWLYSANASDGFRLPSSGTLLTSAAISGQYGSSGISNQLSSGSMRYYRPVGGRTLLFASAAGDALRAPETAQQLLLGGDTGLRGYPRNYQSGYRRLVFTVEERAYGDWYPFRLFRIGGAVFYDVGRAWGGPQENTANAGWLNDVGFGLRILSTRSASGTVAHIDFAFPLNRDANIRSFQFLVSTKVSL
jgi:outer membrane protein assembly factor BamA